MPRLSKIGAAALAAFGWTSGSSVTATYLVVAGGGGGGGQYYAGGGGAGGYLTGSMSLNPSLSYTVTVGAGGVAGNAARGGSGGSSVFNAVTASGGGGGGANAASGQQDGASGASGGGGSSYGPSVTGAGGTGNTPSTSPSQGNNGGSGNVGSGSNYNAAGGGGGGSGGTGSNASVAVGGNGGAGTSNSISGSALFYAGGGGGGAEAGTAGTGGSSVGGNGQVSTGTAATAGTANRGGGGGGSGYSANGGNGGSGVVIISYTAPQKFSGGVVTLSGGNVIHTFTTSGTLGPITTLSASYLIVAGGGGGGYDVGGGGGAGGLLSGSSLTIDPNSTYLVTVGAGGTGASSAVNGVNGSNSAFSMVSTAAVGGGGGASASNTAGSSGGSGGGGTRLSGSGGTGGSGTSGQGNAGGAGSPSSGANVSAAGGGGGAGAVGANASNGVGGNGGIGSTSSISGTSTYYAGGGGGRADGTGTQGTGGSGGGGTAGSTGTAGTANTGGGGGGGSTGGGGNGGSGIVIISYAGSTQQMAGGTVTITGGNVIHTFTSTGYLAPIKYATNSLRFRASNTNYLNRTPSIAGNRTTWTFSAWVKRGQLSNYMWLLSGYISAGTVDGLRFQSDNSVDWIYNGSRILATSQLFRDPAAWYHLVFTWDTTQSTAANRARIYVNGVQVTAFSTSSYPSQNSTSGINNATVQRIGVTSDTINSEVFDGYMTEINFVDGQALTPSSFGTFNSYGVWQPITYGGSYGTNGFYLPFTSNTSSYVGSFNGSNQYLATTNTQIIPATGDFTVEAMIYKTNTNAVIYSQGTTGNAGRLEVTVIGTALGVQIGAGSFSSTATINNNQWYYIALTRTGSTATFYVNGVAAGSGTLSAAVQTTPFWIGLDWTSTYFGGYISNLRVSNVVRTISPATAPTSSFSNDANTVFLTLQSSTIVDNSSNAYAITNNNTVTTGQTYPFAYGIFNDKGPAGNNWTPNNISGAFGTTLDYMTDVPTLTSATVANYAVPSPINQGSYITLSNGNLTVTGNTAANSALTLASIGSLTSGKWYWEYTQGTVGSETCGITTTYTPGTSLINGENIGAYGIGARANGNVYGGTVANITSWTTGDVIGLAVDCDNGAIYWSKNGTWLNSGVPTSGASKTGAVGVWTPSSSINVTPAFGAYNGGFVSVTFGQQPLKYTPPSGYVALNTYNL